MSFGTKLKELRISKNMTQLQLAKKLSLSKANISKYEADLVEPNLKTLSMIAVLFDVSVDYLLEIGKTETSCEKIVSEEQKQILDLVSVLSKDNTLKLIEYAQLLRKANN